LRAVRGEFRIFSSAESGTEIHASVPLAMAARELNTSRRAAAGSLS
jgi:hypothetical protein